MSMTNFLCARVQVELEGLTGHVEFNSKGQRTNYILKIVQRSKEGLKQVISVNILFKPVLSFL